MGEIRSKRCEGVGIAWQLAWEIFCVSDDVVGCWRFAALRSAKELRAPQGKENLPASGAAAAEGGGVGTPRNHSRFLLTAIWVALLPKFARDCVRFERGFVCG